MGVNFFGIPNCEQIQITGNSLQNPGHLGGLNSFANIHLDFPHEQYTDYRRSLNLNTATAHCQYLSESTIYNREYFASYPDNVLVIKLTSSKEGGLSFKLRYEMPYIKDYAKSKGDGGGKMEL